MVVAAAVDMAVVGSHPTSLAPRRVHMSSNTGLLLPEDTAAVAVPRLPTSEEEEASMTSRSITIAPLTLPTGAAMRDLLLLLSRATVRVTTPRSRSTEATRRRRRSSITISREGTKEVVVVTADSRSITSRPRRNRITTEEEAEADINNSRRTEISTTVGTKNGVRGGMETRNCQERHICGRLIIGLSPSEAKELV